MNSIFSDGMFPEFDKYIKNIIKNELKEMATNPPPPNIDEDEVWSLQKAATVIGLSTQTLAKMLKREEIFGVKPGRKWKLTKNNVTLYMNRKLN